MHKGDSMTKQEALIVVVAAANMWSGSDKYSNLRLEDALEIIHAEINDGKLKLEG